VQLQQHQQPNNDDREQADRHPEERSTHRPHRRDGNPDHAVSRSSISAGSRRARTSWDSRVYGCWIRSSEPSNSCGPVERAVSGFPSERELEAGGPN
jgi:hypothetical protein